jgi:formyltetrahydrofolate deformylase
VESARLLISCADRPGIVASVAGFLAERGSNIVALDQHSTGEPADGEAGEFFMRLEFTPLSGDLDEGAFASAFGAVAERFGMRWQIAYSGRPKRVAVLVSSYDHCLVDLLWRWRRGELACDIGVVISNHVDLANEAVRSGVEFAHVPVTPETKPAAETQMLELLGGRYDLVVLARYMQILSGDFLDRVGCPVINIHHSFLPSFAGADPYRRAAERGVKLIGATAHYVTPELDEGPIIEQDVERVHHGHDVAALTRIGEDVERTVLARAVRWHLDDRVLVHGPRTVVFA